jgi:transcriptional regulator with XRE-family HTH domain
MQAQVEVEVRAATESNGLLTLVPASEDARPAATGARSGPSRVLLTRDELHALIEQTAVNTVRACLAALPNPREPLRVRAVAADPVGPSLIVEPGRLPLAELVVGERRRLSVSLEGLAKRIRKAAAAEASHSAVSRQDISQIERKGRIPHPDALRWLAHALEVPVERVVGAAEQQRVNRRYAKRLAALDRLDMALVVARSAASGDEDRSEGVISSARRPTTGLGPRIEE